MSICMVSVDVEEDPGGKTFDGVENMDRILTILDEFRIRATLFVTGTVLERFPYLVERWSKGHEIACHGYYHLPLYEIPLAEREKQLRDFCRLYEQVLGGQPRGFKAVNYAIDNIQLELIQGFGFTYDSSVIPSYPFVRKYVGYKGKAPAEPYYPSYNNYRQKGNMEILEIPLTPLIFGIPLDGTWLRVFGPHFFKFLLAVKKPRFISLPMHSWDSVRYEGRYSRNSGERFIQYLENMLKTLTRNYRLMSGEDICSETKTNKS